MQLAVTGAFYTSFLLSACEGASVPLYCHHEKYQTIGQVEVSHQHNYIQSIYDEDSVRDYRHQNFDYLKF